MSESAYRQAIADVIRDKWSCGDLVCTPRPDARPSPQSKTVFFSIHQGSESGDPMDGLVVDQQYSTNITISLRGSDIPWDRFNITIEAQSIQDVWNNGIEALKTQLKLLISSQYIVMNRANWYINKWEGEQAGFVTPMVYTNASPASPQPSSWWNGSTSQQNEIEGISQTLSFGRARRIEYVHFNT